MSIHQIGVSYLTLRLEHNINLLGEGLHFLNFRFELDQSLERKLALRNSGQEMGEIILGQSNLGRFPYLFLFVQLFKPTQTLIEEQGSMMERIVRGAYSQQERFPVCLSHKDSDQFI